MPGRINDKSRDSPENPGDKGQDNIDLRPVIPGKPLCAYFEKSIIKDDPADDYYQNLRSHAKMFM